MKAKYCCVFLWVIAFLYALMCVPVWASDGGVKTDINAGSSALQHEEQSRYKTQLPSQANLLFRPHVKDFFFKDDIYAFVKNKKFYYALIDVIDVFELPIRYDDEKQKGKGWFLREDWKINFDIKNNVVTSKGQAYEVTSQDYIIHEDITYIAQAALNKWLELDFHPDIEQ